MSTSTISIRRVERSRVAEIDFQKLTFGTSFSDHMLVARFRAGRWGDPAIEPYGPLPLPPSISALHYGLAVFEGMKAHRSPDGEVLLFRPRDNARRINRSAARLAMPDIPEDLFLDGLRALLRLDGAWVPPAGAGALYIRPSFFSVQESIRVIPAEEYAFVIFTCPFGTYFAAEAEALVTERYVRAFPGGTGDGKPAGNYAGALLAEREAREQGFTTVMWLDARERRFVEECGVMNVFFVLGDSVVTPELTGTILPGITRDSVLRILRDMGLRVAERPVEIGELVEGHDRGTLLECFGTGTAATVAPVRRIRYRDRDLVLPAAETRKVGPAVRERLVTLMTGRAPDPYGWVERA